MGHRRLYIDGSLVDCLAEGALWYLVAQRCIPVTVHPEAWIAQAMGA